MVRAGRARLSVRGYVILAICALVCAVIWWRVLLGALATTIGAALLAALLLPIASRLEARMNRGAAAGLSMLLLAVSLLLFLGLAYPAIATQAELMIAQLPTMLDQLNIWTTRANEWLDGLGAPLLPDIAQTVKDFDLSILVRGMVSVAGGMIGRIAEWLLVPMLAFYFLKDRDLFCHALSMLIPINYRRRAIWTVCEARRVIIMYLRGRLLVSLFVGCFCAIGMLIIGVNAWLALGVWIAVTDNIPYFGPIIGTVPVVLLSPVIGMNKMLWSVGVIFLANQVEANWFPKVVGEQTGIHPVTVLLAITIGNMMFGVWGLVLSLPVIIAVKTVERSFRASEE